MIRPLILCLTLTGCGSLNQAHTLTPKQIAVGIGSALFLGAVIAHQQDSGKPVVEEQGKRSCYPGSPCLPPGGK